MKLDFDHYQIKTAFEDEEKEKAEARRREEAAALLRKDSMTVFTQKLFDKKTIKSFLEKIEPQLSRDLKPTITKVIDGNKTIKKLWDFY